MPVLRLAKDEPELAALHDLRDAVLFRARGKTNYNRNHPDDLNPHNYFMGFWDGEHLVGTVRIDFLDDEHVVMRLVAIHSDKQRAGLGRQMIAAAERYAVKHGRKFAVTNAAVDSEGFYARLGYEKHVWDDPTSGPQVPTIQMRKIL